MTVEMEKYPIRKLDFYVMRMDRCQNCGNQALEIYDYFNNPMGYKSIIDLFMSNQKMPSALINKRAFYTIRCKKCGHCYPIMWLGGFPIPEFSPSYIGDFMASFRSLNHKGKGK